MAIAFFAKNTNEIVSRFKFSYKYAIITAPTYYEEMDRYNQDEITDFWNKLSKTIDFLDFTGYNKQSYDARNFYDIMHYNNEMGEWVVHKIHGKGELLPDGFGKYTGEENVKEHITDMF